MVLAPVAGACLVTLGRLLPRVYTDHPASWAFLGAFAGYPLVHYTLFRPVGLYVVGHELAHAVAAWASGLRVKSFFVGSNGGHVTLSGSNVFVALAPYCFPFYTLVVILGYSALRWMYALPEVDPWFYGAVGATFGFHLVSTVDILREARQPDLREAGVLPSMVAIFFSNVVVLLLVLKLLFPGEVSLQAFALQVLQYLEALRTGFGRIEPAWVN